MKTSRRHSSIICVAAIVVVMVALPARLAAQAVAVKSSDTSSGAATQSGVQVDRVNVGDQELSYSLQVAIYENLLEELNKTKQFKQVFRDGDRKADEVPNLLVLKTTVEKYTPGNETRRAVTTVSGATKLTVRSQLLTRGGKIVLDRRVDGNVRLFGSNLRATHNLARNIAKAIKQSRWLGTNPRELSKESTMVTKAAATRQV
jgi:hypothetical protein